MDLDETTGAFSRRRILVAGAGTALGGAVLAACAGSNTASSNASAHGSRNLAKVADVPVGGAVSATGPDGKPVIVAQPTGGKLVAFSAICTHMGCTVAPQGNILQCPCHLSTYDLATGDNTGGPAPRPLAKIAVTVKNGEVVET